jgi:hypothetical protein
MPDCRKYGQYYIIPASDPLPATIDLLTFDSNVVVDIARHFYRDPGFSRHRMEDLLSLLIDLPAMKDGHGKSSPAHDFWLGVAESARTSWFCAPDELRYRRNNHAMAVSLTWTPAQWKRKLGSRYPPANGYCLPEITVPKDSASSIKIDYVSLLKMRQVLSATQGRGKDWGYRLTKYIEWANWCNRELQYISGYALQIAVDLFLGSGPTKEYTAKLLHMGAGNESIEAVQKQCWNTACDIVFLRQSDRYAFGGLRLSGQTRSHARTVLISGDKGLVGLRKRTWSLTSQQNTHGRTIPINLINHSDHPGALHDLPRFEATMRELFLEQQRRVTVHSLSIEDSLVKLAKVAETLEQDSTTPSPRIVTL